MISTFQKWPSHHMRCVSPLSAGVCLCVGVSVCVCVWHWLKTKAHRRSFTADVRLTGTKSWGWTLSSLHSLGNDGRGLEGEDGKDVIYYSEFLQLLKHTRDTLQSAKGTHTRGLQTVLLGLDLVLNVASNFPPVIFSVLLHICFKNEQTQRGYVRICQHSSWRWEISAHGEQYPRKRSRRETAGYRITRGAPEDVWGWVRSSSWSHCGGNHWWFGHRVKPPRPTTVALQTKVSLRACVFMTLQSPGSPLPV